MLLDLYILPSGQQQQRLDSSTATYVCIDIKQEPLHLFFSFSFLSFSLLTYFLLLAALVSRSLLFEV
jgi:hypothetical protein